MCYGGPGGRVLEGFWYGMQSVLTIVSIYKMLHAQSARFERHDMRLSMCMVPLNMAVRTRYGHGGVLTLDTTWGIQGALNHIPSMNGIAHA